SEPMTSSRSRQLRRRKQPGDTDGGAPSPTPPSWEAGERDSFRRRQGAAAREQRYRLVIDHSCRGERPEIVEITLRGAVMPCGKLGCGEGCPCEYAQSGGRG